MKFVARYEYTVECTDEQFAQAAASWEFEILPYMDSPPQTEGEFLREVFQYMIEATHGGDFTDVVTETGYDEVEWDMDGREVEW